MYVCQEKCFLELSDTFYGKYLCFHLSFKCVDGTLQLRTLDTLQREWVWRPLRQEQPHPLGGYVTLRDSPRLSELHLCARIRTPRLQVCLRDLNFHNLGLRSALFLS